MLGRIALLPIPRRIMADSKPNGPYSFSPDGQFIVFESKQKGIYLLCVVGIDGQDFHQLTKNAASTPAWQPDGASRTPRPLAKQ
jgi:Tol biopolymer transport system component